MRPNCLRLKIRKPMTALKTGGNNTCAETRAEVSRKQNRLPPTAARAACASRAVPLAGSFHLHVDFQTRCHEVGVP